MITLKIITMSFIAVVVVTTILFVTVDVPYVHIQLPKLNYSFGSLIRSNVSVHNDMDNMLEYEPRLKTPPITILYWTTHIGQKVNYNSTLRCGTNYQQVCQLVSDRSLLNSSHAVVFYGWRQDLLCKKLNGSKIHTPKDAPQIRHRDQYWVLLMLESPHNYRKFMRCYDTFFNWTWTYRTDSDIFMPYGRFSKLRVSQENLPLSGILTPLKNKTVALVLSNCNNAPSKRLDLVKKLQEHIQVDIFGKCGPLKCPSKNPAPDKNCKTELGKMYKFYLALENSLCQDYVTEKTFHAYASNMVPIVYGGADYDLFLPRGSYIDVNSFPSAKSLVEHLKFLDANPEEYLKYFEWKRHMKLSTDGFDYHLGYCKLCEKIHREYPLGIKKIIPNMTNWLFRNEGKNYSICNDPLVWSK